MTYNFQTMRLRALLILFLMLSYVTAPVIDAVACDDCANPVLTHQQAGGNLMRLPDLAGEAGHGEDHPAPSQGTAKDLCPLCANAAVSITSVQGSAPTETMQCVKYSKLLAFSDPVFPITKPPQN
jgi:hypothetical protein